ncbi:hypothetical protein [Deinococcus arenicola]|uniref:Uncharacterized protein n=1 Tax=Deinococcus arenicola TaxID=2994950 RepID=A0ABU4DLC4_9DEIO|nr:hypothetical protein [Deinococcus sp. ZS9-10]MDV6373232.1 hypothetical protein [Deinococcus sp. ZS9-10]
MAHPDLKLIPVEAAQAFAGGDERLALTLLARARDLEQKGSRGWAVLERLHGLVLIHVLREVEGTFALERADALLDGLGVDVSPLTLTLLEERLESGPHVGQRAVD